MDDYRIIADSCCDLTDEMKIELHAQDTIPFYIHIAGETFTDDNNLKIPVLLQKMKACTSKMTTGCPSPQSFKDAFVKAGKSFAVTISSKLSGSFNSAQVGKQMAEEEGAQTYVFDSKSASSGEVLIAYKVRELIEKEKPFDIIVEEINQFIQKMRTFFVLDDISNLVKNGRMSKITGTIVNVLGIKPILGDRDGEIELFGKVRGAKHVTDKLVETIADCGRHIDGDDLVITHCNNLPLANELMEKAKSLLNFGKIHIIEMRGLSSFYACDKGICISF